MYTLENTQPISASGYNTSNMLFSKPTKIEVKGASGAPAFSYQRIMIGSRNEDKSCGKLLFYLPKNLFCWGIAANLNPDTQKPNGYSVGCPLWNSEGETDEQKAWIDIFNAIIERCKSHLLDTKNDIGKYDLEASDLKKLNPLYWKREKGIIVQGKGPTIYLKLLENKKNSKIVTTFTDENGNVLDPLTLINKQCTIIEGVIDVESIFVGNKISIQMKLYEVSVKLKSNEKKSFIGGGVAHNPIVQGLGSFSSSSSSSSSSSTFSFDNMCPAEEPSHDDTVSEQKRDDIQDSDKEDEDMEDKEVPVEHKEEVVKTIVVPKRGVKGKK
jgi:hypothetical protein